jgi:hypothetical protein
MVTVKNYNEEIKNVDLSKLPKELLEEEEGIIKKFKFYGRSEVITDAIDTYLELINTQYKKEKPKPKLVKKAIRKDISNPNVLQSETINGTTISLEKQGERYKFLVAGGNGRVGTLKEMEQKYNDHRKLLEYKEGGYLYDFKTIGGTTIEYSPDAKKPLIKVNGKISFTGSNAEVKTQFDEQVKALKKALPSESKKASKKPKEALPKKIDKNDVDSYSILFTLLRRFKNFIAKEKVTFSQVRLLFMSFSKSALQRKVRLNEQNAKLFEMANRDIVKIFQGAEDNIEDAKKHGLDIKLSDPKRHDDIIAFLNSKQINISIRLLNRFISMQGTFPEKTKVNGLIKSIDNAIKKDNLKKENRLYNQVIEAQKELKKYLKAMETPLKVGSQGLTGSCTNRVKCEGLTKNGLLKKGYKFKIGGNVIKIRKKAKA